MPVFSNADDILLQYAVQFIGQRNSSVTVLDAANPPPVNHSLKEKIKQFNWQFNKSIEVTTNRVIDKSLLSRFDLMLISYESWENLVQRKSMWMKYILSTLIIKKNVMETSEETGFHTANMVYTQKTN